MVSRQERIELQLSVLSDQLIKLRRRPAEPHHSNARTTVHFEKKFASGDKIYRFVATLGDDGMWYITGQHARAVRGRGWDELLDFVEVDAVNDSLATLRLATKWKVLVAE